MVIRAVWFPTELPTCGQQKRMYKRAPLEVAVCSLGVFISCRLTAISEDAAKGVTSS